MNKYSKYTSDEVEELLSNYLVDSWSYSRVSLFARNEKAFEMEAIYMEKSKRSVTSIAGNAYHEALRLFFTNLQSGDETSVVDMESAAYGYLEEVGANEWRLSKTAPTVEQCVQVATTTSTALIRNFMGERDVYVADLEEVLAVEEYLNEWLTVNGVDIPLPCHTVVDLVIRLKDGRTVIIDHKAKKTYTDEEEVVLVHGKQAITYVLAYEAATGTHVDEVWFIENKVSDNKDGSAHLRRHVIVMDNDSRRLYEALLYEPLRRMVEAVSDPDYVYTINDNDNLSDRAELYRFWTRTLIAEADDFNVPEGKKEMIAQRQRKIRDASLSMINPRIITQFQKNAAAFIQYDLSTTNMTNSEKIEHVLRTFGKITKVAHALEGYSADTYLLEVAAGGKLSDIMKYKMDIAAALNVASVRMASDLVVYEGRSYFSIEAPKMRNRDLPYDSKYLDGYKIPIGIDNFGHTVVWDMNNHSTPHMLVCGATGSGKSVSLISTLHYAMEAGVKDIIIFDPKFEFVRYKSSDVQVYNKIEDIENKMLELVEDMEDRAETGRGGLTLVIFDEFADAVANAKSGAALNVYDTIPIGNGKMSRVCVGRLKSLEENLKILLQKGRSLGFRIIAATQRASVKVITGDAKVNFPVQICFRVPKALDSKVVLDEEGAEALGGKGDGLMRSPEYLGIVRFQGFYKA